MSRRPNFCFLFLIALEFFFEMIKSNPHIKDLNIFNYNYLCTAYADDTFVLNSQKLIKELMKSFRLFSKFSGLKRNILKSEDAGIGPLKGIKMAVCGIKFNLNCTFFIKSKVTNTKRFCEKHHQ